jgi:hypothetical protein
MPGCTWSQGADSWEVHPTLDLGPPPRELLSVWVMPILPHVHQGALGEPPE